MISMTTAIYFDLDGTLISYPDGFRSLFEEAVGFSVEDRVFDFYVDQLFSYLDEMVDRPYVKAFRSIEDKFNLGISPIKVAERYIEIEVNATKANSEMLDFMAFLSDHYKVGVLTNGDGDVQRRKVESHSISEYAEEIIVSNDVKKRKPDKEIFELAKECLKAENYVYIGDTFDEDIKPAKETGFKTVYISGEDEADIQSHSPEAFANLINLFTSQ